MAGMKWIETNELIVQYLKNAPTRTVTKAMKAGILDNRTYAQHRDSYGMLTDSRLHPKARSEIALLFGMVGDGARDILLSMAERRADIRPAVILALTGFNDRILELNSRMFWEPGRSVNVWVAMYIANVLSFPSDRKMHDKYLDWAAWSDIIPPHENLGFIMLDHPDPVLNKISFYRQIRTRSKLDGLASVFLKYIVSIDHPEIIKMLDEELLSNRTRFLNAVEALGFRGDAVAVDMLTKVLYNTPDRYKQECIIQALGQCNGSTAPNALIELATSDKVREETVRVAAIEALANFDDAESERALHQICQNAPNESTVRTVALTTLGKREVRSELLTKIGVKSLFDRKDTSALPETQRVQNDRCEILITRIKEWKGYEGRAFPVTKEEIRILNSDEKRRIALALAEPGSDFTENHPATLLGVMLMPFDDLDRTAAEILAVLLGVATTPFDDLDRTAAGALATRIRNGDTLAYEVLARATVEASATGTRCTAISRFGELSDDQSRKLLVGLLTRRYDERERTELLYLEAALALANRANNGDEHARPELEHISRMNAHRDNAILIALLRIGSPIAERMFPQDEEEQLERIERIRLNGDIEDIKAIARFKTTTLRCRIRLADIAREHVSTDEYAKILIANRDVVNVGREIGRLAQTYPMALRQLDRLANDTLSRPEDFRLFLSAMAGLAVCNTARSNETFIRIFKELDDTSKHKVLLAIANDMSTGTLCSIAESEWRNDRSALEWPNNQLSDLLTTRFNQGREEDQLAIVSSRASELMPRLPEKAFGEGISDRVRAKAAHALARRKCDGLSSERLVLTDAIRDPRLSEELRLACVDALRDWYRLNNHGRLPIGFMELAELPWMPVPVCLRVLDSIDVKRVAPSNARQIREVLLRICGHRDSELAEAARTACERTFPGEKPWLGAWDCESEDDIAMPTGTSTGLEDDELESCQELEVSLEPVICESTTADQGLQRQEAGLNPSPDVSCTQTDWSRLEPEKVLSTWVEMIGESEKVHNEALIAALRKVAKGIAADHTTIASLNAMISQAGALGREVQMALLKTASAVGDSTTRVCLEECASSFSSRSSVDSALREMKERLAPRRSGEIKNPVDARRLAEQIETMQTLHGRHKKGKHKGNNSQGNTGTSKANASGHGRQRQTQ